jgi:hypothetical protein
MVRLKMKLVFTWVMVLGIIAGLHFRTLGGEGHHFSECTESTESCCSSVDDRVHQDSPQHDGDQCPLEHSHHHECCAHMLPLTFENDKDQRLYTAASSTVKLRHEREIRPDEPYLGSEKPPLI